MIRVNPDARPVAAAAPAGLGLALAQTILRIANGIRPDLDPAGTTPEHQAGQKTRAGKSTHGRKYMPMAKGAW